ncbi:GmrSD restriction endonuclease domain-containing protein [Bacilliculturomica massiliensis]|uniref:GmrSD restriction endonuclease domain-containing protein n=1 Tax=Bacilliculturomica massiliensis TaxID=1917867 RepID=UPI0013EF1E74|nr:DUF262 domain-containing protein [Bacilliculturomica massiliensis]
MKYQHLAVPIREAYELYRCGTLFIPSYQRDFVWGKKQQRNFIESILEGQPCGAVLLARKSSGGEESLELVDGQQRLRTIFQFIDGGFRFSDDGADLTEKRRKGNSLDSEKQNETSLSLEDRARFLEYPLAITFLSEYDQDQIASIIENINMKASPLSSQELRRAKARVKKDAGSFSGIVEHVSAEIRRMPLGMPADRAAFSDPADRVAKGRADSPARLDAAAGPDANAAESHAPGRPASPSWPHAAAGADAAVEPNAVARPEATFWPDAAVGAERLPDRRPDTGSLWTHLGIFREEDMLRGADQELVARILYSVLAEKPAARSTELLDNLYDGGSLLRRDTEKSLRRYGPEKLQRDILSIFSLFTASIAPSTSAGPDQNETSNLVFSQPVSGSPDLASEAFYLLFLAVFNSVVKRGLRCGGSACFADGLRKMRLVMSALPESDEACRELEDYASFLIQPCFAGSGITIRNSKQLEAEFEASLSRSLIETSLCEFKQGFLRLSPDRQYDRDLETRILQTLCGMANIGASKNGTLYIGIADKKSDANKIARLDSVEPICYMEHYVVGIQREAALLGISVENYCRNVEEFIDHSPLSRHLAVSVLSQMDVVDYRGFTVIRLIVPPQDEISYYGDYVYLRKHSMTTRLSNAREIVSVSRKFR